MSKTRELVERVRPLVVHEDGLAALDALARRIEVLERLVTPAWELRNALDRHPCEVCGRVAETEHAHGAVCWRFEQALRATDALSRLDSLDDTTQSRGEHGE